VLDGIAVENCLMDLVVQMARFNMVIILVDVTDLVNELVLTCSKT